LLFVTISRQATQYEQYYDKTYYAIDNTKGGFKMLVTNGEDRDSVNVIS